jgi:hypothetical protein
MTLPPRHKTVITLSGTPDSAGRWHLFLHDVGEPAPQDVLVGERAYLEHVITGLMARKPDHYLRR